MAHNPLISLEPGAAFLVNGHFACVTHVSAGGNRVLILVADDPRVYQVTPTMVRILVQDFQTNPHVEVVL